ncbi:hypothetical protein [Echinicola vietnamensis]|uniref:Uncharacterized protein n=1 Tax=Echinicola vietnamensis (strain DSM 17526 / LMG 23754 / KMM 6221) TaxID=926556 RepID=L0FTD1_ECHVK|nr:hypothetical protein [Echinicola vietnamensis]AGA76308.1 hypothetical protein Echvi_0004 [Echinicola vietnamensis DSM 17526]
MKNTKRLYYLIGLVVLALLVWMMRDTFTQPGTDDLKMDFREVAAYRNENNTGPIKRVYAVVVSDSLWHEMEQYGKFMPHTKYGNTQVYFFTDEAHAPKKLNAEEPYFEESLYEYCIGRYEKKAMGQEGFVKYPFR